MNDLTNWVVLAKRYEKGTNVEYGAPYWNPNQAGYTHRIRTAGLYTEAEAKDIADGTHGDHMAYRVDGPELMEYLTQRNLVRASELTLWLELQALRATAPRPAAGATGVVGEAGMPVTFGLVYLPGGKPVSAIDMLDKLRLSADRSYKLQGEEAYNHLYGTVCYCLDVFDKQLRAALTTPPAAPEAGAAGEPVKTWRSAQNDPPSNERLVYVRPVDGSAEQLASYQFSAYGNKRRLWVNKGAGIFFDIAEWREVHESPAAPVPPSATRCEGNCATAQGLCVNPACPMEGGRES